MTNIQLIDLTVEEYLELKKELITSKMENWKTFFLRVVKEWKQQQKQ